MTEEKKSGEVIVKEEDPKNIVLGDMQSFQVAGLTDEQIQELKMLHGKGMLDIHKKAQELKVDVGALDATLSTLATQTEAVSKAGDHVTITHSQSTSVGRTEVVMGNTEKAAQGKLSKSQTGEDDNTLKYVIIGAVVTVIIALVLNK